MADISHDTVATILGYAAPDGVPDEAMLELAGKFAEFFEWKDESFNRAIFLKNVEYEQGLAQYELKKGDYEGLHWYGKSNRWPRGSDDVNV